MRNPKNNYKVCTMLRATTS